MGMRAEKANSLRIPFCAALSPPLSEADQASRRLSPIFLHQLCTIVVIVETASHPGVMMPAGLESLVARIERHIPLYLRLFVHHTPHQFEEAFSPCSMAHTTSCPAISLRASVFPLSCRQPGMGGVVFPSPVGDHTKICQYNWPTTRQTRCSDPKSVWRGTSFCTAPRPPIPTTSPTERASLQGPVSVSRLSASRRAS
jgi:hypothetical protein